MRFIAKFNAAHRPQRWRARWLTLHTYLGLIFGLIFVLAGVTGSLLVFYINLDEWLNPQLQLSQPTLPVARQSYENLLQALKATHPEREGAWRMELPRNAQTLLMARYYQPKETAQLHFAPLIVWVNPYTAQVVSSRFWGQYLMTWLYDLHYTLLLDLTGKTLMAIIGGFITVSLLSGVYLWWPSSPKALRTALTFKPQASTIRFNYDLHKISGIYSLLLLFSLVCTGILLELPDIVNPLINRFSPLYPNTIITSRSSTVPRLSVDKIVALAQQRFPNATLRWIETPKNAQGSYRIVLYQTGEPSWRFPKTTVWLDQYTGVLLAVRDPQKQSTGDIFLSWLHPLHSGEIAGLPGRWLVWLSGFVPIVLYVTGVLRWQQKRQAKQPKK